MPFGCYFPCATILLQSRWPQLIFYSLDLCGFPFDVALDRRNSIVPLKPPYTTVTESHDEPSKIDLERFKLEVSRQHLQYLKYIRTRGYSVDDTEITRLESELAADEAKFQELLKKGSDDGTV